MLLNVYIKIERIYQKRWISRSLQECGIKVWIDLNVSRRYAELNLIGVPIGYNAFITRGYADRIDDLNYEYTLAQRISLKDNPRLSFHLSPTGNIINSEFRLQIYHRRSRFHPPKEDFTAKRFHQFATWQIDFTEKIIPDYFFSTATLSLPPRSFMISQDIWLSFAIFLSISPWS